MAGQANAFAMSDNGTLIVNKALLKELMGRPEQLACVVSHELAHITQNHSEEERKASRKYDAVAASRISERVKQLQSAQTSAYVMLVLWELCQIATLVQIPHLINYLHK